MFVFSFFIFRLMWVRGCGLVHFLCSNQFISGIHYYMCHEVLGSHRVYYSFYLYYYGTSHMQRCCNCWCVRNLLVMVLRLNKSLKLAESIVSLHPH